jgi:hypothetical protein
MAGLEEMRAMRNQRTDFEQATVPSRSDILESKRAGRRDFLRSLSVGAAGAVAFGATALDQSAAPAAQANLDIAILEFALNLEYLEAEFYLRVATGRGLSPSLIGPNPGMVTGGAEVPFTSALVKAYAQEIAEEEMKHVEFLRAALTALTGSVIGRPALDLSSSFTTLANAAGLGSKFNAYENDMSFLLASYVFEDVGVTAYHGAAPLLSNKAILDKAAGILAVEAYHAGLIRTVLFATGAKSQTQAISNLRATLDGTAGTGNVDDHGVGDNSSPAITNCSNALNGSLVGGFPTDNPPGNNAIAYDRTTRQVLNVVLGAKNATKGLFFPDGLRGVITS